MDGMTIVNVCPRCLCVADHSPDEKACSDNCITRHLATIAMLSYELRAEREKHDEEAYNDMAAACEVLRRERDEANRLAEMAEAGRKMEVRKNIEKNSLVHSLQSFVATLRAEREHMARKSEDVAAYEAWQLAEKRNETLVKTLEEIHYRESQCHPEPGSLSEITHLAILRVIEEALHPIIQNCFARHPTIVGLMCGLKQGHDGPHRCEVHHEEWE